MNKFQVVINSVLAGAIAVLFVLFFYGKNQTDQQKVTYNNEVAGEGVRLAFVNIDTLLNNYVFAQEAQETLMSKQEDARLKLNTRARTLQNEMADFQRKYENNAFLSRERAESEYNRLQKKQQELQELEEKLTQDILQENQNLNMQLRDTLDGFLKEYNATANYHVIFANTQNDNILLSKEGFDITTEIVDALNKRYKK